RQAEGETAGPARLQTWRRKRGKRDFREGSGGSRNAEAAQRRLQSGVRLYSVGWELDAQGLNITGQHRQLVGDGVLHLFRRDLIGRRRAGQGHHRPIRQEHRRAGRVDVTVPVSQRQAETILLIFIQGFLDAALHLRPAVAVFLRQGRHQVIALFLADRRQISTASGGG